MEDYFERVVETLTGAGYRWYETANFCRTATAATSARATTSATGSVTTTSGSASAPSRPSAALRWRNAPSLPRYLAALGAASGRSASSSSSSPGRRRASG